MFQPAQKCGLAPFVWTRNGLKLILLTMFVCSACWAQLPSAGDTTSPPVPNMGHDYIHSPVETVNPANGSVSIRVPIRMPEGRELTIPLNIAYGSNGAFYYVAGGGGGSGSNYSTTLGVPFTQGGWTYTFPLLTHGEDAWTVGTTNCEELTNYVFQDSDGSRDNMELLAAFSTTVNAPPGSCGSSSSITQAGVGPLLGTITSTGSDPTVTDGNGTVYSFDTSAANAVPLSITDRNGNTISISTSGSGGSMTDTVGRTAVSVGTFGANPDSISVSGLSSAYQVSWTTVSPSFTISVVNLDTGVFQNCPTSLSGSAKVISQVVLPNGQKYAFTYDSTYGMLDKMTYPSGGYVRYVWGLNHLAEAGEWSATSNGVTTTWGCQYDFPAITDRYVSLDGSTEVLHQHFSYTTNWESDTSDVYTTKTTQVTTTTNGTSFNTVYSYTGVAPPPVLHAHPLVTINTQQSPVEQCIEYYDASGSGGTPPSPCPNLNPGGQLLKTVIKGWNNLVPPVLSSAQTTLGNGQSSLVVSCYNSSAQVTETDEYDFGTTTIAPPSCSSGVPSSTTAGSLLRKTTTNYATFTGAHIVDLPSSIITYNGSGTRVAETDSSYDQTSPQATSVVQHATAPGGTARGNLTTATKQCFNGCGSANSTTTYSYFDTGQVNQMTDPCGNVTCSDMTGTSHTTTYSYADSYSSCGGNAPPSGSSGAYLTMVTYPATSVSHTENYCYDYRAGELRAKTDENSQLTSYTYSDSLDRLTQVTYPDGGQTLVSYSDAPPTPSVTINKKLNSSSQYVTSVTITDGMGLPIQNELTSDPAGTDFTVTTYDGLGRPVSVTNPYRTTSDSTYGVTTYSYDALGRTLSVTHPDGTTVSTSYANRATAVTDEGNGTRRVERISQSDGLGRLVSVCEVTSTSQQGSSGTPANCGQDISGTGFLTTYSYDALDNLLTVGQSGLNPRAFNYDSLSHLTSAGNPESGSTNYSYDASGNLYQKKDARTITTTYNYDVLNRVTQKSYSDGMTPSVFFQYDGPNNGFGVSATNLVGRLDEEWTGTSCCGTTAEIFGYDPMGRVVLNEQYTVSMGYRPVNYTYDLSGNVLTATNGEGVTLTSAYNTAAQLATVTSSLSDPNHPAALLPVVGYNPLGDVTSAIMGNGVSESSTYDNRGRVTSSATQNGGTAGTGTVTISGSERSTQILPPGCRMRSCAETIFDHGTISITVDGFQASYDYGGGDTSSTVASGLTTQLNGASSPVTAAVSGSVITITSLQTGSASDYTLSSTAATGNPTNFSGSSFTGTPSGSNLTGGSNGGNVYNFSLGYAPNSDVTSVNDSVNGNWTYTYDDFNRVATASATGQAYTYGYDQFGNRWNQELNGSCTAGTALCLTFNTSNRINNGIETYDAAGNTLTDGFHNYTYDAENRLVCVSNGAAVYVYNAEGQRAQKIIGASSCSATTGNTLTNYVYDLDGHEITEVSSTGVFNRGEVYAGGRHIATYSNSTTYFNHSDWLGTERARTGVNGVSCETMTSLAFGDDLATSGSCGDPSTHHFTGKEHDSESNLDNFGARYDSSSLGRFMSADPSNAGVDFELPQTWNRYSYVINNPLSMVDRNGQWPTYTHNKIIEHAFPGMSARELQILKDASTEADTHQESYNAWMHAMSDGNDPNTAEAIDTAIKMGARQIDQDEAEARVDQAQWLADGHTGLSPLALQKFGNALHIITDGLSPAHRGYQPWYGQSRYSPSAILHFLREANRWDPAVNTSIQAARDAFFNTFGSMFESQILGSQKHLDKSSVTTIQGNGQMCGGNTGVACSQ